ncbi:MAG: NADPH-dependent assimilatory sulfite reductase hemoprotein subunit, partial [Pseudolabrys sp.]|nr:NADPH-dependent assimilatory sulfite reductase hemoprotein subunit [Pseudolabrys sp.]
MTSREHGNLRMTDELSRNEYIKEASAYLRGTLTEGLAENSTAAIVEDDQQLVKFHGMYLQDDRDLRPERTRKKLEKAFAFMIRVRMPGGVVTPQQYLALDHIAKTYGNGTMRLTTRQTVQLHGLIKFNLKATLRAMDDVLLDSIAACGDVNRNVMANPNPYQSKAHAEAIELARTISTHLMPRTPAYREVWLDGERIAGGEEEVTEPIYGKTYLPRKFKTVIAVPPSNDVDVYAHDLGCIAILDGNGDVTGWNVTVGGGMGMTHGETDTYPRAADMLGFCRTEDAVKVAEAVLTTQRDWGDRKNRKHARLKYTIEDRGLDNFRAEVEKRAGIKFEAAKPFKFTSTGDRYGWSQGDNGNGHLTLFVENGRIHDRPGAAQMSALRRIAEILKDVPGSDLRMTANQNIIIANVPTARQAEIETIARDAGLLAPWSGLRRNSMACVALPTCGLALAESERYLPSLIDALDESLANHGLSADDIVIRMTGCPNGCARPYLAEIGLVGRGPGRYHL